MQLGLQFIYTYILTAIYVIILVIFTLLICEIRANAEFNEVRIQRVMSAEEFWENIRCLSTSGIKIIKEEDSDDIEEDSIMVEQTHPLDSVLKNGVKNHGSQSTSYKEEVIASNYINTNENGVATQEKLESPGQSNSKKNKELKSQSIGVDQKHKSVMNNDKEQLRAESSRTNLKDYVSSLKEEVKHKPQDSGKRIEGGSQGKSQNKKGDKVKKENTNKNTGDNPNTSEECKKRKGKDKLNTLVIVDENGKFVECFQFKESDYEDAVKRFNISEKFKKLKKEKLKVKEVESQEEEKENKAKEDLNKSNANKE